MDGADVWEVMLDQIEKANQQFVTNHNAYRKSPQKWTLGLGKVQGMCGVIIAASDRIPYAWKIRMITKLEEITQTIPTRRFTQNNWPRSRSAIKRAIRHLKESIQTSPS